MNAGEIASNIRTLYGDRAMDFLTEAVSWDFINRAQRRFCHEVLPLDEFKDYTLTAKQPRFDLPTNCITPIWLMWYKSRSVKLQYTPPDLWARVMEGYPNSTGTPERYTLLRRQLVVGPQVPSAASANTTASGEMDAADTTLGLVAASGTFRSKGFVKVEDEVIEYTAVSTTTLTGCVRGVHNTTAATHASAIAVTEVDLQMLYRRTPTAITASTATPDVPEAYQDYLEQYALYLAWLAQGNTEKAMAALTEFEKMERRAIKTIGRRAQDGLIHIQEKRRQWPWG